MSGKQQGAPSEPAGGAHTPGPWIVGPVKRWSVETRARAIVDSGNFPVSFSPAWDEEPAAPEEAEANARLIAAAPLLLEAVKAQHQAIDTLFAMLIERSAPGFYPSKSGQPWDAVARARAALAAAQGV